VGGLVVPGAAAQDVPTPVQVVDADELQLDIEPLDLENLVPLPGVQGLGFNDVEQRIFRGMTMEARATEYSFGDDPTGAPIINPPGTSLIGTGSAQVRFDNGFDMPSSGTMTQDMLYLEANSGITPGADVTLIWFEFADPVDLNSGLSINEGIVFARENMPYWMSSFAGDTWEGGYLMPTVTYSPNPFNLSVFRYDPAANFVEEQFPGFVVRDGTMMIYGIDTAYLTADGPLSELRYGLHLHWAEQPFTPGFVATYPERVGRMPASFPLVRDNPTFAPNTYCCFVEPVVETTTTASTTTSTEAPATTAAATETTVGTETTLPDGGNLESGSFRVWVPIIIVLGGLAIALGGYWVYYKTRERPRPGGDTGDGDEEDGEDPRDTPPPVVYGEEMEHSSCDWAVYFHDGTKWVPLREPSIASHECCVYRIRVRTKIRRHSQVAKVRQDAGDDRLQIPDYDFAWTGLNLDGHTSTRSGPRGRLDWMQGLGDPTEQAELASEEEYRQQAQGEEPPELAVHLEHSEVTRVEVKLEAGCPEYTNTYRGWGGSTLAVMATQECTNDDPAPECPVELNAFGWSWGEVWGDLNYWFGDFAGTDLDELEGAMRVVSSSIRRSVRIPRPRIEGIPCGTATITSLAIGRRTRRATTGPIRRSSRMTVLSPGL
jgi:hypothetical protein